jgi:ADP-ribose pyrophosphatase YjhB (NUDIX family)
MGHPPGAVCLPSPAYVGLAPAVARIGASWGATPAELVALLGDDGPPGADQLAAIAWVLSPDRGQLLLVEHRTYGWSCPGGHVEHGEWPSTAATRELEEESGLHLAPVDDDPVTLTLVHAPADSIGPPHRHWLLGYRFVADPATPLVPERDPLAWHPASALPRDVIADIPPLWAFVRRLPLPGSTVA